MLLTEQDFKIFQALAEYRYLTTSHISRMFFGFRTKATRRMKQLFDNKLVGRITRPVLRGSSELVYHLVHKGALSLAYYLNVDLKEMRWYIDSSEVSREILEHQLRINDFRIVLENMNENEEIKVGEWIQNTDLEITWSLQLISRNLYNSASMTNRFITIKPDAYIQLITPNGERHFFLEIDMGTESRSLLEEKFWGYIKYLIDGQYEKQFSYPHFNVMTITHSDKRMEDLMSAVIASIEDFEDPRCSDIFLFNTFERIEQKGPLNGWTVPGFSSNELNIEELL